MADLSKRAEEIVKRAQYHVAKHKQAEGPKDTEGRPIFGRERYPEFKPLVDKIVVSVIRQIQAEADQITSEMPYKQQFTLEEVINQLKDRV